jgi:hypothetical protein
VSDNNLSYSDNREILRIDQTVHRPTYWWTPAVHELLKYLEVVGFSYSPRVLGFDEEGREVLSFIEGESGADGWAKITTDEGLSKFARLLRAYHEAVRDFTPDPHAEWAYSTASLQPGEILCHGDFGPWNIVWQGDEPVGILDWDMVLPAQPRFDVLYALQYATPFRDDATALSWHHFPSVPDRKHRIEVFANAYGLEQLGDIVGDVASLQRRVGTFVAILAERGLQPQADWVADGALEEAEKQAQWTEAHRELFL